MSQKNITILILVGVTLIAGLVFLGGKTSAPAAKNWADNLVPVNSISHQFQNHLHGFGYDSGNERLFLASHYGLFVMQDSRLYQLGQNRDDFMGFSLNQRNPNIIYSSGHSRTGGNLGVMKSVDGGLTFERIFSNIGVGRVDFHSMAISYANPDILYGFFQGRLYRTKDGGNSWEFAKIQGLPPQGFCWGVPCLIADTKDENVLYAGTQSGLARSVDFGDTWEIIENDAGAIVSVGVDPQNNERIFAFTENYGIVESVDGGKTWGKKNNGLQFGTQESAFAFSFDTGNPARIFLATTENQVYRTENGGESWEKIL